MLANMASTFQNEVRKASEFSPVKPCGKRTSTAGEVPLGQHLPETVGAWSQPFSHSVALPHVVQEWLVPALAQDPGEMQASQGFGPPSSRT